MARTLVIRVPLEESDFPSEPMKAAAEQGADLDSLMESLLSAGLPVSEDEPTFAIEGTE